MMINGKNRAEGEGAGIGPTDSEAVSDAIGPVGSRAGGYAKRPSFRRFWSQSTTVVALMRHVLPSVVARKGPGDTVRVWVPECGTGEAAYSLAIIVIDYVDRLCLGTDVRIFATDLDPSALTFARKATYPASEVASFVPDRLERFFGREGECSRVNKRVRDSVVFSSHDFFADPPLSQLDIVWCSSLVVDRSPELAARMFPLLSCAIQPGGYLCLSAADRNAPPSQLFSRVSGVKTLHRREPSARTKLVSIAPAAMRPIDSVKLKPKPRQASLGHALLLRKYAPPSAIIDEKGEVLELVGQTGAFLEAPPGPPTRNLLQLARPEVRGALQRCLHLAMTHRRTVATDELPAEGGESIHRSRIVVTPIVAGVGGPTEYIVAFEPPRELPADATTAAAGALRDQLEQMREELRRSSEEFQFSNEELRSENEELISMNEELRAANESLETSSEELRTITEEAGVAAREEAARVYSLTRAVADAKSVLEDVRVPTLVLDWRLHVESFTRSIADVFRLIDTDVGRPIADIAPLFSGESFLEDARHVLQSVTERESTIQSHSGNWYVLRMRTGRKADPAVIVTFTDVTAAKRAELASERRLAAMENRLRWTSSLLDALPAGLSYSLPRSSEVHLNRTGAEWLDGSYQQSPDLTDPLPFVWKITGASEPTKRALHGLLTTEEELGPLRLRLGEDSQGTLAVYPLTDETATKLGRFGVILRQSSEKTPAVGVVHDAPLPPPKPDRSGDFSAEMAHELKDPLSVIMLSADLGARSESTVEMGLHFAAIHAAAQRSARILQSILSLPRLEPSNMSIFDVHELVRRAVALVPDYVGHTPRITLDLAPGDSSVRCNAVAIEQVFVNLLKNSVEVSEPNACKIMVRSRLIEGDVILSVTDNGPGILAEDPERVFERFYSKRPGGTGVGLSLARHTLTLHQGSIRVAETSNKGTTFEVRLPRVHA